MVGQCSFSGNMLHARGRLMSLLKKFIVLCVEWRNCLRNYFLRRKIIVASMEATINKIIDEGCSISRFGDGEFYCMDDGGIKFQEKNSTMSNRLKDIFMSNEKKHLICISSGINPKNYSDFTSKHVKWMKKHFRNTIEMRMKYIDVDRKYYNLLVSRFWIPFKDKKRATQIANHLKCVWKNRDVVIIEGVKTRMGVGNDLLANVSSCKRILCPATNAFDKYDEILNFAKKFPRNVLFLIALGPTATILAYDLYKLGYQALDIGHVDLEYEWMKLGTEEQVNLFNKFVNELPGGDIVDDRTDDEYKMQIEYVIE